MSESQIRYLNAYEKQKVEYCVPTQVRDHQVVLNSKRIKKRIDAVYELRDSPIAIVAYGPSLNDTWEKIKEFKYIISCSGSHKFLIDRGIIPTWHVDVDPREHKPKLIGTPHPDVEYLIASACHPKMFDLLEGYNVKLWHVFATEGEAYQILPPGEWAIMGGSSVGLRAMTIARFLGFRDLHIFGMDGCEGKTGKHAGPHPNQPNGNFPTIYEGVEYITTPAMLECARQTFHELNELKDVTATFYGEGLVQHMAKNYVREYKKDTIIAIRKQILISDEYRKLNEELYQTNGNYGVGGYRHAEVVLDLYDKMGCSTILDYGCGKGTLGRSLPFPIWEYDPAIPNKNETPREADLVVCLDVLEHVEPDKLIYVLSDLARCTKKVGYFSIHTKKSIKFLADGRNTHLIQEGQEWWVNQLSEFFNVGRPTIDGDNILVCVVPKTQPQDESQKDV